MEIVKKNIISIICGVIILAAIISLFWPIAGMQEEFTTAMGKRAAIYDQLKNQKGKIRSFPVVELGSSTEAVHLEQFPGQKVLDAGQRVAVELARQSKAIEDAAVKMNRHLVLESEVFPKTNDAAPILRFRDKYREMVLTTIPQEYLLSTTPPTDIEIDKAMDKLWDEKYVPQLIKVEKKGPDGEVIETKIPNLEVKEKEFLAEVAGMPKRIRDERANKYQCYLQDAALSMSEVMASDGRTPSLAEVWYAQVSLWVQQDLARSIQRVNAGSKSVSTSPVKHILQMQVTPGIGQYLRQGASSTGMAAPAGTPVEAAPADPSAPLPLDFTVTPTGRVCNSKYDVVQFNLKLVVDASSIPMLLQEISREKNFISQQYKIDPVPSTFATITKLDITAVDNAAAFEQGYMYGERPVVELTLQGESLFLRAWTLPLMPHSVKIDMGIEQPPADASKTSASAY